MKNGLICYVCNMYLSLSTVFCARVFKLIVTMRDCHNGIKGVLIDQLIGKAEIINLFRACFPRPFFLFFSLPFFLFPLSFSRLEVACEIQIRDLRERLAPPGARERYFDVFRAQGTCLVAANVILFLHINKI